MTNALKPIALTLALLAASQNAQAQSAPSTYRDWSVTCDNVKTCMAYSTSANSEGGLAKRPRGFSDDLQEGWMTLNARQVQTQVPKS